MHTLTLFVSNHSLWIIIALTSVLFVLVCFTVFLFIRYKQLSRTLIHLMRGKNGASLEDVIIAHAQDIDAAAQRITHTEDAIAALRATLQKSIYKKSILRYNPFKDLGGNQSFVIALLDGNDDGILISSLHTRDGTRIYAKPLKDGASPHHQLSTEEEHVIRDARTI